MIIMDTFSIRPASQSEIGFDCFDCAGSINAQAAPILEDFGAQANGTDILLNFEGVDRVNSMGLSLLLKLFEDREQQGGRVRVRNLNRMTNMLFKITGLGRFVEGQEEAIPVNIEMVPQARSHSLDQTTQSTANATLKFMANLQTGQQLSGWYLLNTYLQRRLERPIHLEQPQMGQDMAETRSDLFFSKPFDVCSIINKQGFIPLLRPLVEADEVVILMRAEDPRSIESIARPEVVTVSKQSFVYILGRSLCDASGLQSSQFNFQFSGNEIKALQMLVKGRADVLFMLKKTYEGLSTFARGATRVIDQSATHFAYHFFCAAPYLSAIHETLVHVFMEMKDSEQGRQILKDIQIDGWCRPEAGEIQMLQRLYSLYYTE